MALVDFPKTEIPVEVAEAVVLVVSSLILMAILMHQMVQV